MYARMYIVSVGSVNIRSYAHSAWEGTYVVVDRAEQYGNFGARYIVY